MPEELVKAIDVLCEAVNAANDAYRKAMAGFGIETSADLFRVVEDKGSRKHLVEATIADMESSEKLAFMRVDSCVQ